MRSLIDNKITLTVGFLIISTIAFIPNMAAAKNSAWNFNLGLGIGYDNNILKYSDADLDEFDTTTVDSTGEFGIKSKDDFIFSPRADIGFKSKLFRHTFQAGLGAGYFIYAKNDIKNYANLRIWVRQFIRKATYLQMSSTYIPQYYYRNLYATGVGYRKAKFNKNTFELMLAAPIYKILEGSFTYRYENKDFNQEFNERDLKANNFAVELTAQPNHFYKVWGGYEYTIAKGAGRNNPNDRRDTSYDSFLFWLGSRFYLNGLKNREMRLGATISYKDILFQTDKLTTEDRYRFGRQDNRWSITLNASQDITTRFSIGLVFNSLINRSDLPAKDLKPLLDFSSMSGKIVFDYSF
jgi:hypothetical protein